VADGEEAKSSSSDILELFEGGVFGDVASWIGEVDIFCVEVEGHRKVSPDCLAEDYTWGTGDMGTPSLL